MMYKLVGSCQYEVANEYFLLRPVNKKFGFIRIEVIIVIFNEFFFISETRE